MHAGVMWAVCEDAPAARNASHENRVGGFVDDALAIANYVRKWLSAGLQYFGGQAVSAPDRRRVLTGVSR